MSFHRLFSSPPLKKLSVFVMTHGEVPDSFTMNFPETYAVIKAIKPILYKDDEEIGIVSQPEEEYIKEIDRINNKEKTTINPIVCEKDYDTQIPPNIKVYDMTLLGLDNLSNNEWEKSLISLTNIIGYDYFINTERDGLNTVFKDHKAELLAIVTKNIGKVYTGKAIMPNYVLSVREEDKKEEYINIIKIDHDNSKITVDPERVIDSVSTKYNHRNPNPLNFQKDDKPLLQIIENEKYKNNRILLSDYLLLLKSDYNDYDITVYLLNCRPLPKFDTVKNFFINNDNNNNIFAFGLSRKSDMLALSKFQQWLTYYKHIDNDIKKVADKTELNLNYIKSTKHNNYKKSTKHNNYIKSTKHNVTFKLKKQNKDVKITENKLRHKLGQLMNEDGSYKSLAAAFIEDCIKICEDIITIIQNLKKTAENNEKVHRLQRVLNNLGKNFEDMLNFKTSGDEYDYNSFVKKEELFTDILKELEFKLDKLENPDIADSEMEVVQDKNPKIPNNEYKSVSFISSCKNQINSFISNMKTYYNDVINNSEDNNDNIKRSKTGGNPTKRKSKPSKNKKSKKKTRKQRKCLVLYAKK